MKKRVYLESLELNKFRNVLHKKITFNKGNTLIQGDNAVGKTTLATAFFFLLMGKDNNGMSEYKFFKPLDNKGRSIYPREDYSVKGNFIVEEEGGMTHNVTLERILKETYIKRRGESEDELNGHTNEYRINGVLYKKAKEYNEYVNNVFGSEEVLSLCSNINYFTEQLDSNSNKQREILFNIIPHYTNDDIISILAKGKYSSMPDRINILKDFFKSGKELHVIRQEKKSQISEMKTYLNAIPDKIEAIEKVKPIIDFAIDDVERSIKSIDDELEKANKEIANIKKSSISELEESIDKEIAKVELKLEGFRGVEKNRLSEKLNEFLSVQTFLTQSKFNTKKGLEGDCEGINTQRRESLKELSNSKSINEDKLKYLKDKKVQTDGIINDLNKRLSDLKYVDKELKATIQELRDKGHALINELNNKDKYIDSLSLETNCPTCGTEYKPDYLKEQKDTILAKYEQEKKKELEQVKVSGVSKSEEENKVLADIDNINKSIKEYQEEVIKVDSEIKELEDSLSGLSDKIAKKNSVYDDELKLLNKEYEERLIGIETEILSVSSKIKGIKSEIENIDDSDEAINLIGKIKELKTYKEEQASLSSLDESSNPVISNLRERVESLKEDKNKLLEKVSNFNLSKTIDEQIEGYQKNGVIYKDSIANLENEVILIEDFNKTKVASIDDKVVQYFKYVTFELFEQLNNGELRESFNILVDGVHYHKGLNRASQICAGIEIVNAMQKHYGLYMPVFIDNIESVSYPHTMDCQTIHLEKVRGADRLIVVEE